MIKIYPFCFFLVVHFFSFVSKNAQAETPRCGGESFLLRVTRHPMLSLQKEERRSFWRATEKGDLDAWIKKLRSAPKHKKTYRRLQEVAHQWRALGFLQASAELYKQLADDYQDAWANFFLAYDAFLRRDIKKVKKRRREFKKRIRSKNESIAYFLFESKWMRANETAESLYRLYKQSEGQKEWLRQFLLEQWVKHILQNLRKQAVAQQADRASRRLNMALKKHDLVSPKNWTQWIAQLKSYGGNQSQAEACALYRKLKGQLHTGLWLFQMGRCAERAGENKKAIKRYEEIIQRWPGSSHAEKAWAALQRIGSDSTSAQFDLAMGKHFFSRMRWEKAISFFQKARKKTNKADKKRLLWIDTWRSRVAFRQKEYTNCAKILLPWEKEIRKTLRQKEHRKAFLLFVRCSYRAKKSKKALKGYEYIAQQVPRTPEGRLALWGSAQLHAENKQEQEAERFFLLYAKTYPTSSQAKEGLFQMGLVRYRKGELEKARQAFRRLLGLGRDAAARSWFWIGKTYEKQANFQHAKQAFKKAVLLRHGYYSIEAAKRIGKTQQGISSPLSLIWHDKEEQAELAKVLAWSRREAKGKLKTLCEDKKRNEKLSQIEMLTLTGWTEAAGAISKTLEKDFSGFENAYIQMRFWRLLGYADRVIHWGGKMRARMTGQQRKTFPPEAQQRSLFPLAYPGMYVLYGKEYRLPPLFMMGLTRQESLFSPRIVSGAGARGIAQIMPKDAKDIAKKQKNTRFQMQDLFLPDINLRMGFFHFRDYLDKHRQQKDLTLAAYNAGPEALRRWKKEHGELVKNDRDAFLAYGIGYNETRQYVVLCLRWYRTYRYFMRPSTYL